MLLFKLQFFNKLSKLLIFQDDLSNWIAFFFLLSIFPHYSVRILNSRSTIRLKTRKSAIWSSLNCACIKNKILKFLLKSQPALWLSYSTLILTRFRSFRHNIIDAGQNRRRSKSAQKKMNQLCCIRRWLKKIKSFAFNGNSLHWEHDCIFVLPSRLSVNHYYKQVISAQSQ